MLDFSRSNLKFITRTFYCGLGLFSTLSLIPKSLQALEVKVSPSAPQQGDTISVFVSVDEPNIEPMVVIDQKNYPLFKTQAGYRALVPTSPLSPVGKMTVKVQGDNTTSNIGIWLKNRHFPTQRIWLSGKAGRPATQLELDQVRAFKKLVTPQKLWQGSFVRPNNARVSTGFGNRRYYNGIFANDYYHKGVDYAGGYGATVVAPGAGTVRLVGREEHGFHVHGNIVGIDHGQGVLSLLMHLQDIAVTEGTVVRAGEKIGTIGSTGASTGPHLHWGLYVNEVAVDPVPWRFGVID